jgi:lectin, mannose-binding 1
MEYYKRALTVYYHQGLNNDLTDYEICTRIENLDLPLNGHFGVSGATGGLADDQDVIAFNTFALIDHTVQVVS